MRSRKIAGLLAAALVFLLTLAGPTRPARAVVVATLVEATLTDLEDEGSGDLWRIDYTLAQDFAYAPGHALTISLTRPSGMIPQALIFAGCGWHDSFLFADANLLSEHGVDRLATDEACPGGVPSRELGGIEFVWQGATAEPLETHGLVVYAPDFQVLETRSVAVPEPSPGVLGLGALAALLCAAHHSRTRTRRCGRLVGAAAAALLVYSGPARAAEPVNGVVMFDYTIGSLDITLQPLEFERIALHSYRYTFGVAVHNTGAATGSGLLAIGSGQNLSSVSDGLIALPALAQDESATLDPIQLVIERRHQLTQSVGGTFFLPETLQLCVMDEPTPGPSLPEADLAIATLDQFANQCANPDYDDPNWRLGVPQPPKVAFTPGRTYLWNLVTSEGTLQFELFPETAPHHVAAIIYLVRLGFYDGLGFHRVIQGFVAQGGDPLGTGVGGPGYVLAGEFDAAVQHDARGTLSTAHAGPVSDGSQFFITFAPTHHLDGIHTISGRLVEGAEALDAIEALAAPPGCTNCQPSTPIDMTTSTILVLESSE